MAPPMRPSPTMPIFMSAPPCVATGSPVVECTARQLLHLPLKRGGGRPGARPARRVGIILREIDPHPVRLRGATHALRRTDLPFSRGGGSKRHILAAI